MELENNIILIWNELGLTLFFFKYIYFHIVMVWVEWWTNKLNNFVYWIILRENNFMVFKVKSDPTQFWCLLKNFNYFILYIFAFVWFYYLNFLFVKLFAYTSSRSIFFLISKIIIINKFIQLYINLFDLFNLLKIIGKL